MVGRPRNRPDRNLRQERWRQLESLEEQHFSFDAHEDLQRNSAERYKMLCLLLFQPMLHLSLIILVRETCWWKMCFFFCPFEGLWCLPKAQLPLQVLLAFASLCVSVLVIFCSQAPICAVITMETVRSCASPPPSPPERACALQDTAYEGGSNPVKVQAGVLALNKWMNELKWHESHAKHLFSCAGVGSFLLYSVHEGIRGIPLDPADKSDALVPVSGTSLAVGIDFHAGKTFNFCFFILSFTLEPQLLLFAPFCCVSFFVCPYRKWYNLLGGHGPQHHQQS